MYIRWTSLNTVFIIQFIINIVYIIIDDIVGYEKIYLSQMLIQIETIAYNSFSLDIYSIHNSSLNCTNYLFIFCNHIFFYSNKSIIKVLKLNSYFSISKVPGKDISNLQ